MKLNNKIAILSFMLFLLLISCKKENKVEIVSEKKVSSIDTLVIFSFRRSYVDHHLMSEKELKVLYDSDPIIESNSTVQKNDNLLNELEKLRIFDKTYLSLNLKRFEDIYPKEIKYLDLEKKISFKYSLDLTKSNSVNIILEKNNIVIEKKIDFERENIIGMILEDVDKDGVKEILILSNYYIMNGDNYILMINKFVE